MLKKIAHILSGREKQITRDEKVLQPLPHKDFRFANPFIVIHHKMPSEVPAGSEHRIHPHPHRGFAPVTFVLQGEAYHKDNAGHDEILWAGDVQWMFAGKGLLHSEGPSRDMLRHGGMLEFIQLWVNVPRAYKWNEPGYQCARKEEQPLVLEQDGVELRLASGHFDGKVGPVRTFTPIIMLSGKVEIGRTLSFKVPANYWTLLYITHGQVEVDGQHVNGQQLIVFEKENDEILLNTTEDSTILLLSAEPIDEPVAAKDNFVMNTMEEIDQAMEDYRLGRFGVLEE